MTSTWEDAQALQDALQEAVNREDDSRGVVTAFVAIAEVMDGEAKKLVAFRGPNPDAVPVWLARGMMREVVDDPEWFTDKEEE